MVRARIAYGDDRGASGAERSRRTRCEASAAAAAPAARPPAAARPRMRRRPSMSRDRRHRPTPLRARGSPGGTRRRAGSRRGPGRAPSVRCDTSMVCGCAAGRLCRLPRECCLAAGATVRLPTREQPAAAPQAAAAAPRRDCLIRCMPLHVQYARQRDTAGAPGRWCFFGRQRRGCLVVDGRCACNGWPRRGGVALGRAAGLSAGLSAD